MSDGVNVYIGAPDGQTAVSVSSADTIFVTVSAGFTGSGGGGGGATNLSTTRTSTTVTVNSDTGTDATIAAADGTNAGVMTSAMFTKLDGIETGADVTDATNVNAAGAVMESDYNTAHSVLVQQSGSGSPVAVHLGNNTILGKSGGGDIAALTASQVRSLINVEDGADVTDAANVGSVLNAATAKTTPVDADTLPLSDSAAAGGLKKLSWANLKATAKAYFDTIYQAALGYTAANKAGETFTGAISATNLSGTNTGDQNLFSTIAVSGQSSVVADTTGDTLTLVAGANVTITTDASTDTITIAASGGGGGSVAWGGITGTLSDQTDLHTALDGKVDENAAITGATKTKITYDAKGLVTAGADATTADIADSTDKRYVTEAEKTKLANTSGTNTGDQTITLTGDVTGSGTGSFSATIANDAVTNAKLANMDTARIKGRTTAGSGDPEDLTGTQATALLDTFTSSLKGLAPASGGGTSNFLRADGTWAVPAGGGGGGDTTTLYESYAQAGPVNTTTETAVFSFALPTDLAAGDMLELDMAGVMKNNSGGTRSFDIFFKLGTTTILDQGVSMAANANERTWNGKFRLFIVSTSSQKAAWMGLAAINTPGNFSAPNTGAFPFNGSAYGTASEDTTSAKTLQVTVTFFLADPDLYVYCQAAKLVKIAAA